MVQHSNVLYPIFQALSDPTRLACIERLERGPATISTLAEPFDIALPSFMKHIAVLEAAGLVTTEKVGRQRFVRLNTVRLKVAHDWFADRRRLWSHRFSALEASFPPKSNPKTPSR